MLGFVGPGFVKSSKVFQAICHIYNKSVENEEKIFREKKKQLVRGRGVSTRKTYKDENFANVKVSKTEKNHRLKTKHCWNCSSRLGRISREISYVGNTNNKCRCNYIVLFKRAGAKTNLPHFFQVNETLHTETTTDIFLMFRVECFWGIISFEYGLHSKLETWFK